VRERADPIRLSRRQVRIEIEPRTAFQIGGDAMGERTSVEVSMTEPIELAPARVTTK
jgi:hypothetical protein